MEVCPRRLLTRSWLTCFMRENTTNSKTTFTTASTIIRIATTIVWSLFAINDLFISVIVFLCWSVMVFTDGVLVMVFGYGVW